MKLHSESNLPQSTDSAPAAPGKPTRILLVEDNAGDARLIREWIREADPTSFELGFCKRLDATSSRLSQGGVGLVLLDLSLPDSHGIGTFQSLHAAVPQVPVTVLTGLQDEA